MNSGLLVFKSPKTGSFFKFMYQDKFQSYGKMFKWQQCERILLFCEYSAATLIQLQELQDKKQTSKKPQPSKQEL